MPSPESIAEKFVKHLEESLLEDLKTHITEFVSQLVKTEFESLHKRITQLERTMDMWKNDLDEDRANLRDIRTGNENLNTELKEIGSSVDKLPRKLESTVKDTVAQSVKDTATEAIPQAVKDTFDVVSKKVKVTEKPKSWLRRLFEGR